jgi:MSHA pilin protein MshC
MVLVLLGILSATVLPKFFSVSSYQQQAFFDDTLNAVRYAQKLSVATGCKVQVTVSGNAYTLNRQDPDVNNHCPINAPATFSLNLAVRNPGTGTPTYTNSQSGVTLTSTASTFNFDALGRASADVTVTVAGSKIITVVGATGFVYAP